MPTVELAVRDDTLALGADVDEDLVSIDADDGAFDDVAVLEASDIRVLSASSSSMVRAPGAGLPAPPGDLRAPRGRRVGDLRFTHHDRFRA